MVISANSFCILQIKENNYLILYSVRNFDIKNQSTMQLLLVYGTPSRTEAVQLDSIMKKNDTVIVSIYTQLVRVPGRQ